MSKPIQETPIQNERPPRKNNWARSVLITFLLFTSSAVAAYEVTAPSEQPFLSYAAQVLEEFVRTLDEIPDEPLSEAEIEELEELSNALGNLGKREFIVPTVPAVALTGAGSVRREKYEENSLRRVILAEIRGQFSELYTDIQMREVARYLSAIALANGHTSQYEVTSDGRLGFFGLPQAELPWAIAACMPDKPEATTIDFLANVRAQSCAGFLRHMKIYQQNPTDAPLANIARYLGGETAGEWFASWLNTLSSEERASVHQLLSSQDLHSVEHLLPNQLRYQEGKNGYAAIQGSGQADKMAASLFAIARWLEEEQ